MPNTQEILEGKGVLATGNQWDLVVQAQFCAAINRHCIDLDQPSGILQKWGDSKSYYQKKPYNDYCRFWHQEDISHMRKTYAFCYDDVFDQSSTIQHASASKVHVIVGGLQGNIEPPRQVDPITSDFNKLVWEDHFEGSALDYSKWECEVNSFGGGNNELQIYTDHPKNVRVENHLLVIESHREQVCVSGTMREFSSGRLRTKNRGDWKYGRYEIKAKLPMGQGIWPAIWMLPTDEVYGPWAGSGEIDIMEAVGHKPHEILGTLHFGDVWPKNTQIKSRYYSLPDGRRFCDDFHVFALEWTEKRMRWFVDDHCYGEADASEWHSRNAPSPAPFDQRFHMILNIAVGGNLSGSPDRTTTFPQQLLVDYVRVYQ